MTPPINHSTITRLFQYPTCSILSEWNFLDMSLLCNNNTSSVSKTGLGWSPERRIKKVFRSPRRMVSSNKSKPVAVSPILAILPIHHFIVVQGNAPARSRYSSGPMEEKNMKTLAIPSPLPGHRNTTDHYDSSTQV